MFVFPTEHVCIGSLSDIHGYITSIIRYKHDDKPGVNILVNGQKFTTYGTLNFFVSGPILKLFLSAESLTKYSPLLAIALDIWAQCWFHSVQ